MTQGLSSYCPSSSCQVQYLQLMYGLFSRLPNLSCRTIHHGVHTKCNQIHSMTASWTTHSQRLICLLPLAELCRNDDPSLSRHNTLPIIAITLALSCQFASQGLQNNFVRSLLVLLVLTAVPSRVGVILLFGSMSVFQIEVISRVCNGLRLSLTLYTVFYLNLVLNMMNCPP